MPTLNRTPRTASRSGALLAVLFLVAMLLPGAVLAAVSVTPATGGSAISADTAATPPGSGVYTALSGPAISGTGAGDIGAGTLTFTISGAFEFQAGTGSAALSGAGCGTLALGTTTVTTSAASITTTGASTAACSLTFSGLRVRPSGAGTPLATGSITASGLATGAAGALEMVPGAALLSYQTAPSTSATAGSALATQPVVLSQDKFGNVREGDSILLSSVPSTGGFTCTLNPKPTLASGLVTFAGCKFTTQGSYVLRATTAGGTPVDSATITVAAAPATKLVFLTQPGHGTPSSLLASQPVVAIQDDFGNTVASASATILLTKVAPDAGGPGTLLGCSTASTVSGVATFSGCRIDTVGVGYRLTATDTTGGGAPHPYTLATSNKFDVRDRVVFTTQPSSSSTAGVAFATQPSVAVRAGASNTAVNDSTTVVTLSLQAGTGASGATLTCDSGLSRTVSAGVASFTGCRIDRVSPVSPSNPYVIVASASNLSSASSTSVTVNPGAASKLAFTSQPNTATTTQPFPTQPVVAVQDLGGNTVTSGTNSNATITLGIGTNPAGGTLTCSGGLTRAAVAGVATFSGCSINNAGVGYTLTATATGLTGATTSAFTVGAPVASITLTTSAPISPGGIPTITWGGGIVLTTQFGTNGGNKTFKLQATRDNVTWFDIGPLLTTDTAGRNAFAFRPPTNLFYRAVFNGTPDLQAGMSPSVRTVVRQIAILRPTNGGATKSISRNTSITFFTVVRPSRPELPPATVTFSFYRLSGSTWVLSTQRTVTAAADGRAATTFTFSTSGQWYARSIANPTLYNANSVMSSIERYSVN